MPTTATTRKARKPVAAPGRTRTRSPGRERVPRTVVSAPTRPPIAGQVQAALAALEQTSTARDRENLVRFAINPKRAFGVSMANIQKLAKRLGRSHELAAALWESGWYEARMLSAFVEEPARVTPAQMDRWCRDFDNWGICDTVCFKLFDQTPHAWAKVESWANRRDEFGRRAAFALLACLSTHDKAASDAAFARCLPLIERAATDERNFVMKGVSWALRGIGRRSPALNVAAVKVAKRLSESQSVPARWVGKDGLRDITSRAVLARLAAKRRTGKGAP